MTAMTLGVPSAGNPRMLTWCSIMALRRWDGSGTVHLRSGPEPHTSSDGWGMADLLPAIFIATWISRTNHLLPIMIPTLGTLHLSIQIIYPRLTWYSDENAGFQISHDSRLYKSFRRHVSRRPQLQCEAPQWCERWLRFAPVTIVICVP